MYKATLPPRTKFTLTMLVVVAALCGGLRVKAADFSVVVLPDPQHYARKFTDVGLAQTQWIKENVEKLNIRFVTSVGDNVDDGSDAAQWKNSTTIMQVLDGVVPFGLAPGNHDLLKGRKNFTSREFVRHYGPDRFKKYDWYGGASPSGFSSFQRFTGDRYSFIILHLVVNAPKAEVDWAKKVLAENPTTPAIVTTHQFISPSGAFGERSAASDKNSQTPRELWDQLKGCPQIFMIFCGHYHSEAYTVEKNDTGQNVHITLQDYQDEPNGGDGWLRIYTFRPDESKIDVQTWSPTLKRFKEDAKSKFSIEFDFSRLAAGKDKKAVKAGK